MKETVLISQSFHIEEGDFEKAGAATEKIREILKSLGIKPEVVKRVSVAVFEAEMNICMYAHSPGNVLFNLTDLKIEVLVTDDGVGIPDLEKAMQSGWSTATDEMRELGFGAGLGLPNMKENSTTFNIESKPDKGTKVVMTFDYL